MPGEPMLNRGENNAEKSTKNRKRKDFYPFGNYRNYYGYRIDSNAKEDPRLSVWKKEWFEGKDCLDIGCNQGLVTLSIAKKFSCRTILGIDIDEGLVRAAYQNLRKMNSAVHNICQVPEINSSSPDSTARKGDIISRVSFRNANFVESLDGCYEKYDTILCLSLTKWIHLNWGDDGLITLFVKAWRLLRPDGILILEPQPWSSYKRYRALSENSKMNYENCKLHPDNFREILLDKVGFKSVEDLSNNLSGTVAGFNRPILAFHK